MSHISNTIDELLGASKMNAAQLALAGGLNAATISRIRNGVQIWVSPENLGSSLHARIGRYLVFMHLSKHHAGTMPALPTPGHLRFARLPSSADSQAITVNSNTELKIIF